MKRILSLLCLMLMLSLVAFAKGNEMRVCHKSVTHLFFLCVSVYSS